MEPTYRVVSPLGTSTTKASAMAPRLQSFEGKTIGTIWNHSFKADVTLPIIEQGIKSRYPGAKIVSFKEIDAAVRASSRKGKFTVLQRKGH